MSAAPKPRRQPKPKPVDPREESYYRWMGLRIARVRNHRKLTQQQLADKSGYTVASICSIEKGRQRTPLFELFRIGETLGLSDPRVLLPYPAPEVPPVDAETGALALAVTIIDDTIDLENVLVGAHLTMAAAAFRDAADDLADRLADENAAIAQTLGLGSAPSVEEIKDAIEVAVIGSKLGPEYDSARNQASNESEKQEEARGSSVVMVPETVYSETAGQPRIDYSLMPKCRLCGGPLLSRMDQEFQIHSEKCRQAETDAKRKENGTMNIPTVSYDSEYFFDPSTPKEERVQKPGVSAVTIGGATVRFDDPRIIPTPNPHKPEETAFQAGQYVWATREDAAGYLAALDSGRAGAYVSGPEGLRVLGDEDPNVRRATGSESCGICSKEIERDAAILEVKGAGGISTDVGPCCQQFYV